MFIKITALVTLFAFAYSSILYQPVYAVTELVKDSRAEKDIRGKLSGLVLPYSKGRIADGWYTGSDDLVVWIQDLHCQADVQKNIYDIIKIFDKDSRVSKVYLEGAPAGKLDPLFVTSIPDEKVRQKTIDKLMSSGLMSGAEYYRLKDNQDKVYGLEDWAVYAETLQKAKGLLSKKEKNFKIALDLAKEIETLKDKYESRDIVKLNRYLRSGAGNKNNDERYCFRLEMLGRKVGEDINWYPNLSKYIELLRTGKKISYGKLAKEQGELLNELKNILPYKEYSDLIHDSGKESLEQFYYDLSALRSKYY